MTERVPCQLERSTLVLGTAAVVVPDTARSPVACVTGRGLLVGQFARPGAAKISIKVERPEHEATTTWTTERVELLKIHFDAGLSCAQIAGRIGVTRNAVIGKLTRLGLSRPRNETEIKPKRIAAAAPRRLPSVRCKLKKAFRAEARFPAVEGPLSTDQQCSLLELTELKCRWPIGDPGIETFRFCGNERVKGFSYCAGHARMAYRGATNVRRPARCNGPKPRSEMGRNAAGHGVHELAVEAFYASVP